MPVRKKNQWDFSSTEFIKDGKFTEELQLNNLVDDKITNQFNKALMMFEYNGLPFDMTKLDFERFTMQNGYQAMIDHDDRVYIVECTIKDNVTWNRYPKYIIVNNPALNINKEYEINKDCVLFRNDEMLHGLMWLFFINAMKEAQCDLSFIKKVAMMRLQKIFTSSDSNDINSLNTLIDDVMNGKNLNAITTDDLFEKSVNDVDTSYTSNDTKDIIEFLQYSKASSLMDIGINANYNMKREAINGEEAKMNDDALLLLSDNMMKCRKEDIERINNMFGKKYNFKISIDFSSSWKKLRNELKIEQKIEEQMIENNDDPEESKEGEKDVENQSENE